MMKNTAKTLSLILAICLMFSASAFAEGAGVQLTAEGLRFEEGNYLRIGLKYAGSAVSSFSVSCPEGFIIAEADSNGWTECAGISTASTKLTVSVVAGRAALSDEAGNTVLSDMSGYAVLSAAEPESRLVTISGTKYRDGFTATVYANTKLNVINYIELEHYVRGVIANEMGRNYPHEALKAQAITARSYAVKGINGHRSYGFDLCTTEHCQVYRGYTTEYETTNAACEETRGQVLVYGGKVVQGYYYAYSGGYTLSSEDVWINALDYCRAIEDEYYSDYLWSVRYTMDELADRLASKGKDIGAVKSAQITRRHPLGTAAEVTFIGSKGNAVYSKSALLSVLGLKSFVFAFSDSPFVWSASGQAQVADASVSVQGMDSALSVEGSVSVAGADGEVSETDVGSLRISDGYTVASPEGSVSPGWTDEPVTSGTLYISGSGWGHGVGMPQTSARNMANMGFTCEDILKYYYQGIEVEYLADYI